MHFIFLLIYTFLCFANKHDLLLKSEKAIYGYKYFKKNKVTRKLDFIFS